MRSTSIILLLISALFLLGIGAASADHGNTTAEIDPAKPPITVVVNDPEGLAAIFVLPADGAGFFIDFFCIGPTTESELQFDPDDFPLALTVTDCQEDVFDTTEFLIELPSVGGTTSFLVGGSTSSSRSIALLIGGVASVVAIATGGWYARRQWLGSRY